MESTWRGTVRTAMRRQLVTDLHDYLDIHRNLRPLLVRARREILDGVFRPSRVEAVTAEKALGVTRTTAVISPLDAVIVQAASDTLSRQILRRQPHRNAYYSRSHSGPSMDALPEALSPPWWVQWPRFQKKILEFVSSFPFLVVTDIANYFETIDLRLLRNAIAGHGAFEEPLLDFVFFVVSSLLYRTHYSPRTDHGLPQIDLDAPRLLAHAFLFGADSLLGRMAPRVEFTRWMDDFDIGVHSIEEGKATLNRLHSQLSQQGLRLNSKKTKILSARDAAKHFWLSHNSTLNVLLNSAKNHPGQDHSIGRLRARLVDERLNAFLALPPSGNWAKVMKRFYTLLGRLGSPRLVDVAGEHLSVHPDLRASVFRYFRELGFSTKRYDIVRGYLEGGHCIDDASVFEACQLFVDWTIPPRSRVVKDLRRLAKSLGGSKKASPTRFSGALHVLAKYAGAREVSTYLVRTERCWQQSDFAGRQVAAASACLSSSDLAKVREMVARNGLRDALQVYAHLDSLHTLSSLDKQLDSYLAHTSPQPYGYGLPRFLLLRWMLGSPKLGRQASEKLRDQAKEIIADPVYLMRLLRI